MNKYTKELINKTILYFKNKYNHVIDEETATEYLNSLAGFYRIMTKFTETKK
jgi:hypothetical protein